MYNYFMLIGRIAADVEVKEVGDGKKVVNLFLAVRRNFKNMEGTFDTDFFNVSLWEFLADFASDNLKKGSKIAIKGRIVPKEIVLSNGSKVLKNDLVGEKVMFFDEYSDTEIES